MYKKYIYEHKTVMDTDSYLPPFTIYQRPEGPQCRRVKVNLLNKSLNIFLKSK